MNNQRAYRQRFAPRDRAEEYLGELVYRCDQLTQVGKAVPSADLVRLRAAIDEVLRLRGAL